MMDEATTKSSENFEYDKILTSYEDLFDFDKSYLMSSRNNNRKAAAALNSNHQTTTKFSTREDELKYEYYRSNPLRCFAPTKGQPIVPKSMRVVGGGSDNNNGVGGEQTKTTTTTTTSLPKIYSELRISNDLKEDREIHKKKLKTMLKLSLNSIENPQKNLIDSLENSRKKYNEFSRLNKPQPLDISRIESVLKQNNNIHNNTASTNPNTAEGSQSKFSPASKEFDNKTINSTPGLAQCRTEADIFKRVENKTPLSFNNNQSNKPSGSLSNYGRKRLDVYSVKSDRNRQHEQLLPDVQPFPIKDLNDINEELKARKNKLASLKVSIDNIYNYKIADNEKSDDEEQIQIQNNLNPSLNHHHSQQIAQIFGALNLKPLPSRQQPKQTVTIENVKYAAFNQVSNNNNRFMDSSEIEFGPVMMHDHYSTNHLFQERPQPPQNFQHQHQHQQPFSRISSSVLGPDNNKNLIMVTNSNYEASRSHFDLMQSRIMSPKSKNRLRIKQARDKILNENHQKENLNKMTILQPFEETKLLINIDKVPSKLLNSLLNKEYIAPRYIIPPARAFGYFKKATSNDQSNPNRAAQNSNNPNQPQQQQQQNQHNSFSNNLNDKNFILKSLAATINSNSNNPNINNNNNSNNNSDASRKQYDIGLESLQSLKENSIRKSSSSRNNNGNNNNNNNEQNNPPIVT